MNCGKKARKNSATLVIGEVSGDIIATGYVQVRKSKPALDHDSHGYLGFMYVVEKYRRLGLNKVILRDLVSWGQQQGVTNFYLEVYAENNSAIRAYEKFGFGAPYWKWSWTTGIDSKHN